MRRGAQITGIGSCVPDKVVTNLDLEKTLDTSDEWIKTRTGIHERRVASSEEYLSQYGTRAALQALERAEMDAGDVDLVLCATVTPDMITPATACFIQEQVGAKRAAGFDLSAGCSGFLYAFATARAFIESGHARHALVRLTSPRSTMPRSSALWMTSVIDAAGSSSFWAFK